MMKNEYRWSRLAMTAFAVILLNAWPAADSASAAAPKIRIRDRAVDKVVLKDGLRLYGAVLSRGKDGTLTVAVQRDWLKSHAAKFYANFVREEKRLATDGPQQRLQRIRDWIKQRKNEKDITPFLKADLKRLETSARARKTKKPMEPNSQLVLVKVPAANVNGGFRQPSARRRVLLLSWKHRLKNVEDRSAFSLAKELRETAKIDRKPVDLSDRIPKSVGETDRQWAARKAIVEFDRLKRLRFQGTSDLLVKAGGDAQQPVNVAALFSSMLRSQLNRILQESLDNGGARRRKKSDSLKTAIKTAESEKVAGFRVTRLKPDLTAKRVTVEESFVVRMPNGTWETVWSHRETIDASKKRPDIEKRIKADQRVKQALKLVKGLGLGASEEQMQFAIRFGAATQIAQEKAAEKFDDFRDTYSRSLSVKPIRWTLRP